MFMYASIDDTYGDFNNGKHSLSSDVISHFISELHEAASQGHNYTVLELLKQGVDINIKDSDGVSMTTLLRVEKYHWLSFN